MLEVLLADPCRFISSLLDYREIRRVWHKWRSSGTRSILGELSADGTDFPKIRVDTKHDADRDDVKLKAVLVIDAKIPQYDQDAGSRSSFLYLQLLREMGHRVYFMPNDQVRREPYAHAIEDLGVQLILGSGFRCGQWKHWLRDHQNDVGNVVLHRPNVARRYLSELRRFPTMRILYFAHDLRCIRDARNFQLTGDAFHRREAKYWESIERRILDQVDRTYFYSEAETRLVASWRGGKKACTISLFPTPQQFGSSKIFAKRSGLLFVGGFTHQPNRDAALWFARKVFPLLKGQIPDIKWHIIGRDPPKELLLLKESGIIFEGAVSDNRLKAFYQKVRIAVAPLRYGAGLKGKVVEAMGYGVPVVTTDTGAEGIPEFETALCVCRSATSMATHIIDIHQNANTWEEMRQRVVSGFEAHQSKHAALSQLRQDLSVK